MIPVQKVYAVKSGRNQLVWPVPPKGIPLGNLPIGTLIAITVGGINRLLLKVHAGKPSNMYDNSFDNSSIYLQQNLLDSSQVWSTASSNDYANSTIHTLINDSGYYSQIDSTVRPLIKLVKVPYRPGNGTSMDVASGTNGLECYVFLAAAYELNWTQLLNPYMPADGAVFTYFVGTSDTDIKRQAATRYGINQAWWARTPFTGDAVSIWNVRGTGGRNYSDRGSSNIYARPAIVLPDSALVSFTTNPDGSYTLLGV